MDIQHVLPHVIYRNPCKMCRHMCLKKIESARIGARNGLFYLRFNLSSYRLIDIVCMEDSVIECSARNITYEIMIHKFTSNDSFVALTAIMDVAVM
jgi:hypothetical protein